MAKGTRMKHIRRAKSQATRLVELAAGAELFHTAEGESFATVTTKAHRENWPLQSREFRSWLERRFYQDYRRAPSRYAVQDALSVLEARARHDGPECRVYVRVAEHQQKVYLDLASADWKAVEITAKRWRVVANPPVKFRRMRGMRPLPYPLPRGKINDLRRFLNAPSDDVWVLMLGWLIAALSPWGPYPILVLHGEQGSAKSTTARVLGSLIDHHVAQLRTVPRDIRDLMISAKNSWVLCFDNVAHLSGWLSDALCLISTGGALATRQLYTDQDEVFLDVQRPVVLNGIEELATRPDLLDRAVVISLPGIPDHERRSERDFWRAFEAARPRVLGALLKAVSTALRRMPRVQLPRLPRLADFARWVEAAEPALGVPGGTFLRAYAGNLESAADMALESSIVGLTVQAFVDEEALLASVPTASGDVVETSEWSWTGTAGELLQEMEQRTPDVKRQAGWPKSPAALSNALRRITPILRRRGVELEFDRREGHARRRLITVRKIRENADRVDRDREAKGPVAAISATVGAADAVEGFPILFESDLATPEAVLDILEKIGLRILLTSEGRLRVIGPGSSQRFMKGGELEAALRRHRVGIAKILKARADS